MNRYFVSIKVDREERPDIDNLYMEAIQYMGLQGGWPLNVFLMPDKKPFYGGTYFTPNNWLAILKNIVDISEKNKNEIIKSSNIFSGTSAIGSFMISSPVGPRPEKCLDKLNSATIAFISSLPKTDVDRSCDSRSGNKKL